MRTIRNDCIYLKDFTEDISYNGCEHIIPAALGGIRTLPRGAVSDKINHLFSQREMIAVRRTYLSINRNRNGPGKRGSTCVSDFISPRINLFEVQADQSSEKGQLDTIAAPVRLGFIFYGEVQMIPQVFFSIRTDWSIRSPRIVTGTIANDVFTSTASFISDLQAFLLLPNKLPEKDYKIVRSGAKRNNRYFIMGLHNRTWFINSSFSDEQIQRFLRMTESKLLPDHLMIFPATKAMYHYSFEMPKLFDDSYPFIYIKTAFNTLAFLMGVDLAKDCQFDAIRQAIVNGNNLTDYITIRDMPRWLVDWADSHVEEKAHFVVIHGHDKFIEAYVSFYHEMPCAITFLSQDYNGKEFKKFFICDYLNRKETYGDVPESISD